MADTTLKIEENIAGLLCYVLLWVSGLAFLFLLEPENKFVRFHAMQSVIVFGTLTVALLIFYWIPHVGGVLSILTVLMMLGLWIVLMVMSFQGIEYKLPWAGDLAEKWLDKLPPRIF